MADSARMTHVSPGIYSRETEITYAVKSLGITTLGVVGETLKGPAFQPIAIENWREFVSVFGGTSTEKYVESQYPKYELPYIAKSYLSESNQLQVCRVLGLSGYNAGPAWCLTAKGKDNNQYVVAILRSKGEYLKYETIFKEQDGECECIIKNHDVLRYAVGDLNNQDSCFRLFNLDTLALDDYNPIESTIGGCYTNRNVTTSANGSSLSADGSVFTAATGNYGHFNIYGVAYDHEYKENLAQSGDKSCMNFSYSISMNPNDADYILNVLGNNPYESSSPIYVETLYDVAYQDMVDRGDVIGLNTKLTNYYPCHISDYTLLKPVNDILSLDESSLTRADVGKRFLSTSHGSVNGIYYHVYDYSTKKPKVGEQEQPVEVGAIYTVRQYTDKTGKRHYYYSSYDRETIAQVLIDSSDQEIDLIEDKLKYIEAHSKVAKDIVPTSIEFSLVKNLSDGYYYRKYNGGTEVGPVTCDLNNYKEQFRFASTPWFVSNVKGDANKIEVNRLFRFHTISDGDCANKDIKVSIANVDFSKKMFDVVIRAIDDTDSYPIVYETFTRCSMSPQSNNYIAYKIGSHDGLYESKSKYIVVEVIDDVTTRNSVPCGFLGYPLGIFNGLQPNGQQERNVFAPNIKYNLNYNEAIRSRRQYFGLSDISGVDVDMFTYKGVAAYSEMPEYLTNGFHLDYRVGDNNFSDLYSSDASNSITREVQVDGISGYKFDAVSRNNVTETLEELPIISIDEDMYNSIYEDIRNRKFTAYFYGGFDGWDIYRGSRSNTDDFSRGRYNGYIRTTNGEGYNIDRLYNSAELGLINDALTTDYYAYLAAIRQFSNPEAVDINVFATPGIDIVNNPLLIDEVVSMIEEERADSIYVVTTPDKPFGASDFVTEMYTPDEVVRLVEDSEIESNYTCTYYPWVKYEDVDNKQYVYLPPTRDVVRNMAITDNTTYPWFAPAGVSRGGVDCVRAKYITKLADEDVLYEGRINPIKTFASDGVKIWGQKNLQPGDGQLTRIAVRRLLLRMRKLIAISCIGLIFEPNDPTVKNKFMSTVTPIMDNIKSNRGISDYKIEVNDTVESRERRELPAKIFFKPYNALEYITLDFIVTPEAVSFDSI